MYNNKWINIAALFLLCSLIYDLRSKPGPGLFDSIGGDGYSSSPAQYNIKIDPNKPADQKTFTDKAVEYLFKDKIRSLETQKPLEVTVRIAEVGDIVTVSYQLIQQDGSVTSHNLTDLKLGVDQPLTPFFLGMLNNSNKTITLKRDEADPKLFTITGTQAQLILQLKSLR